MIGSFNELMAVIVAEEPRRHACEARWVASFDTDSKRAIYLGGVWDKRGEAAAKALRAAVWDCMKPAEKPADPLQERLL